MKSSLALLIATTLILPGVANAQYAKEFLSKEDAGEFIKQYLKDNPEVVVDALEQYQYKQQEVRQQQAKKGIVENKDKLLNDPLSPVIGPDDADATLVYFFDYNCGFCKRVNPTITKLLEEDKKLKVIFKEFPVLGESSMLAAKYALAVSRVDKGKYEDFHNALMKFAGNKNDDELTNIAKETGIDIVKLKEELGSKDIQDYLARIRNLAQVLGINGTPAFVIGDSMIPGAVDYDTLKAKVEESRNKKN